jgi:hypothetical protein
MPLPKIATPQFSLTLPSNGNRIHFRPFLVKEEKALLMATQSDDPLDMIDAVKNVIASCIIENVNVDTIPYFDLEYIFLNIRSKSIGEIVKIEYRHTGGLNYKGVVCEEVTPVEINLEQVKVEKKDGHTNKIQLDDKLGIEMRYPTITDVKMITEGANEIEMLAKCIVSVYDEENVYEPDNLEDSLEFIESLNNTQFSKIMNFIETMPKLRHTISYKCRGCGQEDTVTLEGMADFF